MISRRDVTLGVGSAVLSGAGGLLASRPAGSRAADAHFRIMAEGLQAPESPKPQADGSILLCEMQRGTLSRVATDGSISIVAQLGGSPNGVAIGPDGAAYVCNNGGLRFARRRDGSTYSIGQADDYRGGFVQRVDLRSGEARTLYTESNGLKLGGPNDLVFDDDGGFWFTDAGTRLATVTGYGGLYWARPDGSEIRRLVYPLISANGIALSPDRRTLYVGMTLQRQVFEYRLGDAPGTLQLNEDGVPRVHVLVSAPGDVRFDSMAVEAGGNIVVSVLEEGGLATYTRTGQLLKKVELPDRMVTSVGFGGSDMRTAYVTLLGKGQLIAVPWPRPGMRLKYS